jgi:hypothetical protein
MVAFAARLGDEGRASGSLGNAAISSVKDIP